MRPFRSPDTDVERVIVGPTTNVRGTKTVRVGSSVSPASRASKDATDPIAAPGSAARSRVEGCPWAALSPRIVAARHATPPHLARVRRARGVANRFLAWSRVWTVARCELLVLRPEEADRAPRAPTRSGMPSMIGIPLRAEEQPTRTNSDRVHVAHRPGLRRGTTNGSQTRWGPRSSPPGSAA